MAIRKICFLSIFVMVQMTVRMDTTRMQDSARPQEDLLSRKLLTSFIHFLWPMGDYYCLILFPLDRRNIFDMNLKSQYLIFKNITEQIILRDFSDTKQEMV